MSEQTKLLIEQPWVQIPVFVIMVIFAVYGGFFHRGEITELNDTLTTMRADMDAMEDSIRTLNNENQETVDNVLAEVSGLHKDTVESDTAFIVDYFKPAFHWTHGEEYDAVRQTYIDDLGEKSAFVTSYLIENPKVLMDGVEYNLIDYNSMRSTYDGIEVYPLSVRDGAVEYMAILTYYVHKEASDLTDRDKLRESRAVIRFSLAGPEDSRVISNVEAWSGI